MKTSENRQSLAMLLIEGRGGYWGHISEGALTDTHQRSRLTGAAASLKWEWHWEQHISSCSACRASLSWRQVERRCFEVKGVGEANTPYWRLEGIPVKLCNTLVMFHLVWTGNAWEKHIFCITLTDTDSQGCFNSKTDLSFICHFLPGENSNVLLYQEM